MKIAKPVYVGIFLNSDGRNILTTLIPPKHPNVHADHITLAFGKAMKGPYELGKVIKIQVIAVMEDECGQAVSVCPEGLQEWLAPGQEPHITVSCAVGTTPKYSNILLEKATRNPVKMPIYLEGVIDYFPRTIETNFTNI